MLPKKKTFSSRSNATKKRKEDEALTKAQGCPLVTAPLPLEEVLTAPLLPPEGVLMVPLPPAVVMTIQSGLKTMMRLSRYNIFRSYVMRVIYSSGAQHGQHKLANLSIHQSHYASILAL